MKTFLKKYFKSKENTKSKIQILELKDILYTKIDEKTQDEEYLFQKALEQWHIGFDYAMAYIYAKNSTHIFLCEYKKIKPDYDFVFAQSVLFRNFYHQALSSIFALLILEEHSSTLLFFEKDELLFYKNIPKLCVNFLKNENKEKHQEFFENILIHQSQLQKLCLRYEIEEFYLINDDFALNTFLKERNFKIKQNLKIQDLNPKLIELELKRQDFRANFLKKFKNKNKNLKLFTLIFVLIFSLSFIVAFLNAYLKHNELDTLFKTHTPVFTLNELDLLSKEQNHKLDFLNNVIQSLESEVPKKQNTLFIFEKLFKLLYENKIKISELEFENTMLKIVSFDDENSLKALYNNDFFILKHKENTKDFSILYLEFKDE